MTAPAPEAPVVLILDDVPANIHMLMETLGRGYRFLAAKDGPGALKKAEEAARLDLVLLDIMMPGMDGYQILGRLKNNSRLKDVPVIFITAVTESTDEAKGFRLGAVDYITKPFVPEVVRARVATHVELKQKTDLLERLAATDGLTGLFNRRKLDSMAEKEFRRSMRLGAAITFMMVDIDHFKLYNDHYGHAMGDQCLRSVALAIQGLFKRPSDVVGRYGGEEFLAVVPGADKEGALHLGRELVERVAALELEHLASPVSPKVTVSAGAATTVPENGGLPLDHLLEAADRMLYEAKENGRNRLRAAFVRPDGSLHKTNQD